MSGTGLVQFELRMSGDQDAHPSQASGGTVGHPDRILTGIGLSSEVIRDGRARFRATPWRGDASVALLANASSQEPSTASLQRAVERLLAHGATAVLTPALGAKAQEPYLEAGFCVHEQLRLLANDLAALPTPFGSPLKIRRGRQRDLDAVIEVDRSAFDWFWHMDRTGLLEARTATRRHRFRVAGGARPAGYAVTGRARATAYIQRLAVAPEWRRSGIGATLVCDALRWARRGGAQQVLVNTQPHNEAALGLYYKLGFELQPEDLAVLWWKADQCV